MPQTGRKQPFSGKQKKIQLLKKRQSKRLPANFGIPVEESDENETSSTSGTRKTVEEISSKSNARRNRYALQFHKESQKELLAMKQESRNAMVKVSKNDLEIDFKYFENYDFPQRPKWEENSTKEQLDRTENRYFMNYVKGIECTHINDGKLLSLFELNLETWRQLWRVLEMSDILLIIVDIRSPALMFPPTLYTYITETLQKNLIVVLNKIDLVPVDVVVAWKYYFIEHYPKISVVLFSSYPLSSHSDTKKLKIRKRRSNKLSAAMAHNIYKACQNIAGGDISLSKWEDKILQEMTETSSDLAESEEDNYATHEDVLDYGIRKHLKYKDGILTIGCIGFPNVGKSSIINALKGRKVVSVSRTPGHTKHFQTIFITENVKLCDCPGLVFPSSTPKHVQVLLGSYPIAQLREPYFSIKYLGERVDLPKILTIQLPADENEWSALAICEAWALKKGYFTAKAARPDTYRAANNILRLALEGNIVLYFYPSGYLENKEKWINHEEIEDIKKLQVIEEVIQELNNENKSSSEIQSDTYDEESEREGSTGSSEDQPHVKSNAFAVLDEE